jgi:hypothetical protein
MDYTDTEQGEYDLLRDQHAAECAQKKAISIAAGIYDSAFLLLDSIDEISGEHAGRIAKAIQDIAESELAKAL